MTEVVYKIPEWGRYLLILLTVSMTALFLYLGISYTSFSPKTPQAFEYFFYVVSLVALFSTYRLITWKAIIYFKASKLGMYFPCPLLKDCNSEYLFVSWTHIQNIKFGIFGGSTKGVSIDLRISLHERNQFFPHKLLDKETEWITVGFTDVFLKKTKVINELNAMKRKNK